MMLQGDLRSVFDLVDGHFVQLTQCRRCHRASRADLRLTAARRTGDGRIFLHEIADKSANCQRVEDLIVCEALLFAEISEYRRHHTACAAGRSRNNDSTVCILFTCRESICAYDPVFPCVGRFVDVPLVVEILRLSLYAKSTRECTAFLQPHIDRFVHHEPDFFKKRLEIHILMLVDIRGQAHIAILAVFRDLREMVLVVDLWCIQLRDPLNADLSAADRQHTDPIDFPSIRRIRTQIHCILVRHRKIRLRVPQYFAFTRCKRIENHRIRAVTATGFGKRTV